MFYGLGIGVSQGRFTFPREAIRNFGNFFRVKGSEYSVDGFFRAFFGTDIEIEYPKNNIFIVDEPASQIGTESFLDTAKLKESVVSHAKELNYLPRSRNSSRAVVNLSTTGNVTDGTKTINKFTTFTTEVGANTLIFSTDRDITAVNDGTGTFIANNVNIYEGTVITEFFDVTSSNTKIVPPYVCNLTLPPTSDTVYSWPFQMSLPAEKTTICKPADCAHSCPSV